MKLIGKLLSLAIPVVTLTVSSLGVSPVNAIPFGSATVYKVVNNGITSVYLSGTANSRIEVEMGSTPRTTARVVGSCGEVRIAVPSNGSFAGLKIDGVDVDASTLSTATLPSCSGGTFTESRPSNFKTPNGQVIIVGKTPGSGATITLSSDVERNVSINSCGFGRINVTESLPLTTFKIGTTNYTLADLPNAGQPPVCRTLDGVSTTYTPSSWP
jgi:hypothetical protein